MEKENNQQNNEIDKNNNSTYNHIQQEKADKKLNAFTKSYDNIEFRDYNEDKSYSRNLKKEILDAGENDEYENNQSNSDNYDKDSENLNKKVCNQDQVKKSEDENDTENINNDIFSDIESDEDEETNKKKEPHVDTEFEKELLLAFNEFDEDGSGTISKEEFAKFMRKLGYRPTLVELQEMIDEVDKDKSGQIGFDEFKFIMTKTIKDEFTIKSSIEAFEIFDKNKTQKFKKDVLLNILLTQGEGEYLESELNDLLKYVTFDENDEMNYKEFILDTFNSFK